ncbi:MAG TPA: hypothetical protein V6D17_04975 [Candidatus Obscuribacterales bacterium]
MQMTLLPIAHFGGWSRLALKFPLKNEFRGSWKPFQSGAVNWIGYNGALWLGTTSDYLYMRTGPGPILALGHPTLQIPWSELRIAGQQSFFGKTWAKLEVNSLAGIRLTLPMEVVAEHAAA